MRLVILALLPALTAGITGVLAQPAPATPGQTPSAQQPGSASQTPPATAPASPGATQPPAAASAAGQPSCGTEASSQGLFSGQARTAFIAECHRRRGDAPSGAGAGNVVSTQRLPERQRVGRSRQECREMARTRRLWGLARHRFLQRCRYGTTRRTPPPLNR